MSVASASGMAKNSRPVDDELDAEPYDGRAIDPDADTVDPAPWLGQVGEGATLESGEAIAREVREMRQSRRHPEDREKSSIGADPEMPITPRDDDPLT
jgi:hypothetical protein